MLPFGDPRLPDRFWDKVIPEPNSGCWLYVGAWTSRGYGSFNLGKDETGRQRTGVAHKMTREAARPDDVRRSEEGVRVVNDHKCRTRSCCNPDHTDRVDEPTNIARGTSPSAVHARTMHCPRGHEYSEENTYVWNRKRYCRACRRRV